MLNKVHFGDSVEVMKEWPDSFVQTCVTSPPYFGLRDYQVSGQIGHESTPDEYVSKLVAVFKQVHRVLKPDGCVWLNLGDSYSAKSLIGIPWLVAFALRADGWYLRQDIIWAKSNPMPESVKDRCTKSHEYLFLLSKSEQYYFDHESLREPATSSNKRKSQSKTDQLSAAYFNHPNTNSGCCGTAEDGKRSRRSVWTLPTKPYSGAHFATFPPALVEPCIIAGSRPGDVVLDPFMGSGTTAMVAKQLGRQYIGCELNKDYETLQSQRIPT